MTTAVVTIKFFTNSALISVYVRGRDFWQLSIVEPRESNLKAQVTAFKKSIKKASPEYKFKFLEEVGQY